MFCKNTSGHYSQLVSQERELVTTLPPCWSVEVCNQEAVGVLNLITLSWCYFSRVFPPRQTEATVREERTIRKAECAGKMEVWKHMAGLNASAHHTQIDVSHALFYNLQKSRVVPVPQTRLRLRPRPPSTPGPAPRATPTLPLPQVTPTPVKFTCSHLTQSCLPQSGCCEPHTTCHCRFFSAICFCRRTNWQYEKKINTRRTFKTFNPRIWRIGILTRLELFTTKKVQHNLDVL